LRYDIGATDDAHGSSDDETPPVLGSGALRNAPRKEPSGVKLESDSGDPSSTDASIFRLDDLWTTTGKEPNKAKRELESNDRPVPSKFPKVGLKVASKCGSVRSRLQFAASVPHDDSLFAAQSPSKAVTRYTEKIPELYVLLLTSAA